MKDAATSYAQLDDPTIARLHRALKRLGMPALTLASALSKTSILRLLAKQACGPGTRAQITAYLDREGAR